jgi:ADP-ribose pyrophosphatase YjhB (NUDIX family)
VSQRERSTQSSTTSAALAAAIIKRMDARWKPSVTVAAIVERDGRFLLVEEQTAEGLMLNNPAGHLEPGESPAEGCARETLEETGHLFRPTALLGIYLVRTRRNSAGEEVTYLRLAFCGELGAYDPRARWTMASCEPCGSRRTKSAAALSAIAARWCSIASRTTWPACAFHCRPSTPIPA